MTKQYIATDFIDVTFFEKSRVRVEEVTRNIYATLGIETKEGEFLALPELQQQKRSAFYMWTVHPIDSVARILK